MKKVAAVLAVGAELKKYLIASSVNVYFLRLAGNFTVSCYNMPACTIILLLNHS